MAEEEQKWKQNGCGDVPEKVPWKRPPRKINIASGANALQVFYAVNLGERVHRRRVQFEVEHSSDEFHRVMYHPHKFNGDRILSLSLPRHGYRRFHAPNPYEKQTAGNTGDVGNNRPHHHRILPAATLRIPLVLHTSPSRRRRKAVLAGSTPPSLPL
ncbi:hypothetical protein K438DRAFT_1931464 [Mycena galopus ATCC 62051]|nr:hypothetical protein K438DRAFT_1931464 [Mycena galopus ATCC 62051]